MKVEMSPTQADSQVMIRDPKTYSLPDDVLLRILARVPGSSAGPGCLSLRGVCRQWRRLVAGPAFFNVRAEMGCGEMWLVTLTLRQQGGLLCKLFDPVSQRCQRLPCSWEALPPSRQFFGYAAWGQEVFVIGGVFAGSDGVGEQEQTSGRAEAFNPLHNRSRPVAPLLTPRSHFACCAGDGLIFAIGGLDADGAALNSGEMYNVAEDTWLPIADMPGPRQECVAEFVNGRVYVLRDKLVMPGGIPAVLSVDAYDPRLNAWSKVASLPSPQTGFQTAVFHERLCVVGGSTLLQHFVPPAARFPLLTCFNTPLIYDANDDEWKTLHPAGGGDSPPSASGSPLLRSLNRGADRQLLCTHRVCEDLQSRPQVLVSLGSDLFLVRRCNDSYCRHIHRFRPREAATSRSGSAWECIKRATMFSNLLREAGDCWAHSVAVALHC